ncbi:MULTISPECIES: thioredoxin family protein [unclassified Streptomyces]|uniref:thioredoxin family protein n=1 Tax=unclassified Streptomyces TaxID=2593676 RepID=UPI001CBDB91E|nr:MULTISPECIES: thioredoxin family protein [unclassified Streptomyces]WPO69172.1 thioredoxin family protein [Streptomyces sp. KN37]
MPVTPITSHKEFTDIIHRDEIALIDFWATWNGPCRSISPMFEALSQRHPGVKCYKVDVDELPDVSQEVGIRSLPTFIGFKNGQKVGSFDGANPGALEALFQRLS